MAKFVTAYNATTGAPQQVPARFLGHPALGRNLRKTPPAKAEGKPAGKRSTSKRSASKRATKSTTSKTTPTTTPAAGDQED